MCLKKMDLIKKLHYHFGVRKRFFLSIIFCKG